MLFSRILCFMVFILTTSPAFPENKSPKVVVIGAGLAGLTTAFRLQQRGVDVQVYEARNRVGGRILTAQIDGKVAELGGLNINDGGYAENIHRLVAEFGLELTESSIILNYSYFTGDKLIPMEQLSNPRFDPESLKIKLDDLAQRSKNMREVLNGILDQEDLLYKTLAVRLAGYEGASLEELSPFYAKTLYHMLLGGVTAAHEVPGEEKNYIDYLHIKDGNALLPETIAQMLDDRLHLNTPLKRVSKTTDGSFVLTFEDDQKIKADIVVLAIPCSVYSDIAFEENVIPSDKLGAIRNIRYGTNAKIIVPFSKPPTERIVCLNDYAGSFYDQSFGSLTLYCTGVSSKFTADTILDVYNQNRSMIEIGFGGACPPFVAPTHAKDQAFGVYEGPVGYSWPNDPYVKGSYSFIAPGQETALTTINEEQGELVKTLFAPIDQKLYFAGEHTSILLEVPGTMEAACESGERTARMIFTWLLKTH